METKKLTREQAMHHRLIWRYVVQHFDECDVYSLKTRAIKKYSIHVALDVNCILCDVYKNDGCQGCPLSKGEKRCYNSDMLYDLVTDGDIEAAKSIRDIELNVEPKQNKMKTKKLTRKQAAQHRLIWRYAVQHFGDSEIHFLKAKAVRKYSIEVQHKDICVLCDVYRNDGCIDCPLFKHSGICGFEADNLYSLAVKGDIEAAKAIRDIELNVKPKNK